MIEWPKVKAWTDGVPFQDEAKQQILNLGKLQIVRPHIAVMPDVQYEVHGATVGTVIPTMGAIIPAAVGVDIGCGVTAVQTTLTQTQLPESLEPLYKELEAVIPVGQKHWAVAPAHCERAFFPLVKDYHALVMKHPKIDGPNLVNQVGTLGGGNHFVELSVDTEDFVWVMLHSGSRGVGNRIGRYFIEKAKETCEEMGIKEGLPHPDLAYLVEGDPIFKDYVRAVSWAQEYAALNRRMMMATILNVLHEELPPFAEQGAQISCHHNYVAREKHFNLDLWITRKGAIYAGKGAKGIIPGSMGTASYIVTGLGNEYAYNSAAHGAGRVLSRGQAKEKITVEQHAKDTEDVVCRKDQAIVDESPAAYKDIRSVMEAQDTLVKADHELHPILVLKG